MDLNRFELPGFGLPLNFIFAGTGEEDDLNLFELPASGSGLPLVFILVGTGEEDEDEDDLFPTALNSLHLNPDATRLPLITLRELTMLDLMNQMTDKPDWHLKASLFAPTTIFNKSILFKWRAEALAAEGRDVTEKMVDWCIAELQYKAKIFEETGAVSVYGGEVVKSDTAIPSSLQDELKHAITPLEDVPARHKDWHPDSNEQVLDLVHPSLFPLVYGKSRILPDSLTTLADFVERCGEGTTVPIPPEEDTVLGSPGSPYWDGLPLKDPFSRKFQWLPCDVDLSSDDGGVRITSYINNLHPFKHADLYEVIEKIIARAIPLWNMTLTPLKDGEQYVRIPYNKCVYDPDTRQVVQPEPGVFEPPEEPKHRVDLRKDYGNRGLQIIVKLANIHLTPEKPEYNGGTWHVEGQLNEHICATALYYYDSTNISTSYLAFRQQSNTSDADDINYPQSQYDLVEEVFGRENNEPAVQEVGVVNTKEGRLLTWPNILQHKVQPFRLADTTKAGHRKILALFLVDPNIRIISTANIPCQRKDWWIEALQQGGALPSLPAELQDHVFKDVEDFPIGLDEAKTLRLELMEERKSFVEVQNDVFQDQNFSLCEH